MNKSSVFGEKANIKKLLYRKVPNNVQLTQSARA